MWNSNVLYFREMVGRYIIILYRQCDACEYVRSLEMVCVSIILLKYIGTYSAMYSTFSNLYNGDICHVQAYTINYSASPNYIYYYVHKAWYSNEATNFFRVHIPPDINYKILFKDTSTMYRSLKLGYSKEY